MMKMKIIEWVSVFLALVIIHCLMVSAASFVMWQNYATMWPSEYNPIARAVWGIVLIWCFLEIKHKSQIRVDKSQKRD